MKLLNIPQKKKKKKKLKNKKIKGTFVIVGSVLYPIPDMSYYILILQIYLTDHVFKSWKSECHSLQYGAFFFF